MSRAAPTPDELTAMADWFDNPQLSPGLTIGALPRTGVATPGYLLRRIAVALEVAGRRPRRAEDPLARRLPDA